MAWMIAGGLIGGVLGIWAAVRLSQQGKITDYMGGKFVTICGMGAGMAIGGFISTLVK
jgi:hypothetical protein